MAQPLEERAILVGVELRRSPRRPHVTAGVDHGPSLEESLDELAALARSAGARPVGRNLQSRDVPQSATLVGAGKVRELAAQVLEQKADVVLFDRDLTPTQLRNLERRLDCKVIDRTQLILDIFARRARTKEGHLQVELAQLNYLLPRLSGRGTEMSRLGGGIGTRGPGETQLETDRRRIFRRIRKIEEQLEAVRASRSVQRRQRQAVPLATIALVGYTNAGKSTLFNRLTNAGVVADSRLFATLDPTVRQLELPSRRRIVLTDTVGFIQNLPTTLVRAFRATLEEVREASLLLHVVDLSSPQAEQQAEQVVSVLGEIGAQATPRLLVLNKADLEGNHYPAGEDAVRISAATGEGIGRLFDAIDRMLLEDPIRRALFRLPLTEGRRIHLLFEGARVLWSKYEENSCLIEADVPESLLRRLSGYLVSGEIPNGKSA